MNLQQTIADLERQAAQYTEAANALRTLMQNTGSADGSAQNGIPEQEAVPRRRGRKPKGGAEAKTGKKGNKRSISPETKAKIGAAMKARHEQKRQAAQGNQEETA
jgi:hypothetical protein